VNTRREPRVLGVIYRYPEPWQDWRKCDPAVLRKVLDWPTSGFSRSLPLTRNTVDPGRRHAERCRDLSRLIIL
jgi:hypothetical protein